MSQSGQQRVGGVLSDCADLAERYYRIAISIRPKYWDASINLAGLLSAAGRWSEAVNIYENIESLMEEEFDLTERLDIIMTDKGVEDDGSFVRLLWEVERRRQKRVAYEKAVGQTVPGESSGFTAERRRDLYYAKGNLLFAMGDVVEAKRQYLKGLTAVGLDVTGVYALGGAGALPLPTITPHAALALFQQKATAPDVIYNPTTSAILQTLAKIYQDLHHSTQAINFYYISLGVYPTANTCNNLGILLAPQRLNESISWYEFGLTLDPSHVHIYTNLGSALKDRGQVNDGITCYQRAITLQPDFFIALANLANVYKDLGRVEEAIDLYRRSLQVKPDFIEAFCNFVNSLLFICDWTDRQANLERIKEIVNTQLRDGAKQLPRAVPTVLPFHTFTYASLSAWMIREISRRNADRVLWNVISSDWFAGFPKRPIKHLEISLSDADPQSLAPSLQYPYPYPIPPPPAPLIHVGYVSSDFNNHPLAHLMQSVFGLHNRKRFKVFCYALSPTDGSPYRDKIEREADVFIDVSTWSLKDIVERIARVDQIHILCNLNGYTKGGRNEIFAARPAPIHMAFMGFAGTMGGGKVNDPENGDEDDGDEVWWDGVSSSKVPTVSSDDAEFFDGVRERWIDYMVVDEVACPRQFVCGEPLDGDEIPTRTTRLVERGLVTAQDDRNRIYTEGMIYMPHTYFVNDHRHGFREQEDAEIDSMVEGGVKRRGSYGVFEDDDADQGMVTRSGRKRGPLKCVGGPLDEGYDSEDDLEEGERMLWRKEQIRRLKMRQELFPWMKEDTVVFANFNQLYKVCWSFSCAFWGEGEKITWEHIGGP